MLGTMFVLAAQVGPTAAVAEDTFTTDDEEFWALVDLDYFLPHQDPVLLQFGLRLDDPDRDWLSDLVREVEDIGMQIKASPEAWSTTETRAKTLGRRFATLAARHEKSPTAQLLVAWHSGDRKAALARLGGRGVDSERFFVLSVDAVGGDTPPEAQQVEHLRRCFIAHPKSVKCGQRYEQLVAEYELPGCTVPYLRSGLNFVGAFEGPQSGAHKEMTFARGKVLYVYYVEDRDSLTTDDIAAVWFDRGRFGTPDLREMTLTSAVNREPVIEFTAQGAKRLQEFTERLVGNFSAVRAGEEIITVAALTAVIDDGILQLSGHGMRIRAESYCTRLEKRALPSPMQIEGLYPAAAQ